MTADVPPFSRLIKCMLSFKKKSVTDLGHSTIGYGNPTMEYRFVGP